MAARAPDVISLADAPAPHAFRRPTSATLPSGRKRCLARYSDGEMYEAVVQGCSQDHYTVRFLGYGSVQDVPVADVQDLPDLPQGYSDGGLDPQTGCE